MQVQPGFSLLQALSGALQPPTARSQQSDAAQPIRAAASQQKSPVPADATALPLAGLNMNAPRGTYLNIRV